MRNAQRNRSSSAAAFVLFIVVLPFRLALAETRFYSESAYRSRLSLLEHESQLHVDLVRPLDRVFVYGGVTVEQAISSALPPGYLDNYVAAYPGIRAEPLPIPVYVFSEYRRILTQDSSPGSTRRETDDWRGGLYAYDWWNEPAFLFFAHPFTEGYGEAVYSSRALREVSGTVWLKSGNRWSLSRSWAFDSYAEAYLKRDRLGYVEENRQAIGPGARLSFLLSTFSAAALVRYSIGTFAGPSGAGTVLHEWESSLILSGGI